MLIRKAKDIASSEITPESVWRARREWLIKASMAATSLGLAGWPQRSALAQTPQTQALSAQRVASLSVSDKPTSLQDLSSYNNYYEFGFEKTDPAARAGRLLTHPWSVSVEGEVAKPRRFDIDDLLKLAPWKSAFIACVAWKGGRW